jgi:hypothetical protein
MFGLFQNTLRYQGEAQPSPCTSSGSGIFRFLSGLFGSSTPIYQTKTVVPAPQTQTGDIIYAPAPMESAPCEQSAAQPACSVPLPFAFVIQRSEK